MNRLEAIEYINASLRTEINEREQEYLLNGIEIANLQENIVNLVLLLSKKIGLDITELVIVSAERAGPRRIAVASPTAAGGRVRPRPIVVRLARRAVRDELLRTSRVRRNID